MSFHVVEPEILVARQGFIDAQAAISLEGVGEPFAGRYRLGWTGSRIADERGSFCVVDEDGPLQELVGDHLRFVYGDRSVLAYCVGGVDLGVDAAVTRRLFAAVELLAVQQITVRVEVLR